ncbi:MAG: hypothetical protein FJ040_04395 [Chloroflexi bacterium]|nr:hypothetical protein [Chloroflexota bacterium]
MSHDAPRDIPPRRVFCVFEAGVVSGDVSEAGALSDALTTVVSGIGWSVGEAGVVSGDVGEAGALSDALTMVVCGASNTSVAARHALAAESPTGG